MANKKSGKNRQRAEQETRSRTIKDRDAEFEGASRDEHVEVGPVQPKNEAQGHYLLAIDRSTVTFGVGPAGTGKTYLCAAVAADALRDKRIKRIIITRPVIEAGENLGFLPGEIDEKFDPYFKPIRSVLDRRLGASFVTNLMKLGRIEALPMAYMRGHTFDDAFVILDEAQNTTPAQMKLFLTRIGRNAKVVVNGDIRQKDILVRSGLEDALVKLKGVKGISVVEFKRGDIVRSGIVQRIVEAYEPEGEFEPGA